ncbi:MAG: alpha/beta hydrolase [Acidimicrobiales bacterium]|nr:alpha/beta hydrolase [Acidimicrobiales bacterium]
MDQDQLAQPIEISRVASRGGSLEVVRWSTGRGRIAVAAHGYLDHGWSWDGLVPHLRSVDLVSFSARGHGNSDRADAYQWTDFVVDLAVVVRSVGAGPIDLIGHSWGAHLALDLAQMAPELVRSIVNIDGMEADHPPSAAPSLIERVRRSADLPFPRSRPGFASLAEVTERRQELTPLVPPKITASFARHGSIEIDGRWHWSLDPLLISGTLPWDSRGRLPLDLADVLARVGQPILLITGGAIEARHLTPDRSIAWTAAAQHPHVEHVHIEPAGHYVHLEHPAVVAAAIEEFLG